MVGGLYCLNDTLWRRAERLDVMMARVCGCMAKPSEAKDQRLCRSHLLRKLRQHGEQLAGPQETHFETQDEVST